MKLLLASQEGEAHFHLLDDLPAQVPTLEIHNAATPAETLDQIADAEIFYGKPTHELLAAARQLRWIQSPSAGVDYLGQLPELVESDVVVTNTRGAHGPSIAEHVFALLLSFTRGIPACIGWKQQKHWGRTEGYRALREIKGATIGIIGFGAIGRSVAQRAAAFEMNVLAIDAQPVTGTPHVAEVWRASRLHDLLAQSDVVVVSAPYTPETHHLIDAAALAAMKPDAYLIVVSRGGIVDEEALATAMRGGKLAGAALDVAEHEPLPAASPLWDIPNVILTPHLAGASSQKERRCVEILRDNVVRYANGEPLQNVVNKRLGY